MKLHIGRACPAQTGARMWHDPVARGRGVALQGLSDWLENQGVGDLSAGIASIGALATIRLLWLGGDSGYFKIETSRTTHHAQQPKQIAKIAKL